VIIKVRIQTEMLCMDRRKTTIMSGVTIGNGAIIAANSHIIKDV
jgi:acetyltransferase-like isoleucine patch superfamily enzyme